MARRSTSQQDPLIAGDHEPSAYPDVLGADDVPQARSRGGSRRGGWPGGGGRWLVWAGRAILWALIIVVVANGVVALIQRTTRGDVAVSPEATPTDAGFPVDRASSFAGQFAEIYLNFNSERQEERSERLAPYLPEGADPKFGWDGIGRMSAGAIHPYDVEVIDAKNAIVTVTFQSEDRRMLLSVPVYYNDDRFVVSGLPGVLPAPAPAALEQQPEPERDTAAENELRPQLEGFFKAYAAGDDVQLRLFAAPGERLQGFSGTLEFVQLRDVTVPPGGAIREITAEVVWSVPSVQTSSAGLAASSTTMAGKLTQAYRLTVEKQGDKWFVKEIRGASRSVG